MKKAVLIIAAAALTGCAMPHYEKAGMSVAQRDRDQQECNYEAEKSSAGLVGAAAGVQVAQLERKCMALRGYTNTF